MPLITAAPVLPVLSCALWVASVAAIVRSTCCLAAFALTRGEQCAGRVYRWQAAALALGSALLLSVEAWQAAVPFGVAAAGCGALWRQERNREKRQRVPV
jgi:hypothetical protein